MSSEQVTLSQAVTTDRGSEKWSRLSWEEKRQRRRELDGHSCCNCGRADRQLHVHHIFPDGEGGTDNIKNLRTFCNICHKRVHADDSSLVGSGQNSREAGYVPMESTVRDLVSNVRHPRHRCVILLLAKTGIGVGELTRVDLTDIRLRQNPLSYSGIGPRRPRVPNHITVDPSNTEGIPGTRGARLIPTKVPLDRELATELRRYLTIRPDSSPEVDGDPLFVWASGKKYGEPLTHDKVHDTVTSYAREAGLYETGGGKQNLTPRTLYLFFKQRYRGQPSVRDYIIGDRDTLPMPYKNVVTDFREGSPSLVSR